MDEVRHQGRNVVLLAVLEINKNKNILILLLLYLILLLFVLILLCDIKYVHKFRLFLFSYLSMQFVVLHLRTLFVS